MNCQSQKFSDDKTNSSAAPWQKKHGASEPDPVDFTGKILLENRQLEQFGILYIYDIYIYDIYMIYIYMIYDIYIWYIYYINGIYYDIIYLLGYYNNLGYDILSHGLFVKAIVWAPET